MNEITRLERHYKKMGTKFLFAKTASAEKRNAAISCHYLFNTNPITLGKRRKLVGKMHGSV